MLEQQNGGEGQPIGKPKKPPGFRNFEKLLKQVISAPPIKDKKPSSKNAKNGSRKNPHSS